jgi:hypothetical protein
MNLVVVRIPLSRRANHANARVREPREADHMTTDEAVRWAETRACKSCRKSDKTDHAACATAQEVAELIRALAEKK